MVTLRPRLNPRLIMTSHYIASHEHKLCRCFYVVVLSVVTPLSLKPATARMTVQRCNR